MLTDLAADQAAVRDIVSVLRLLADPTRIRLLSMLQVEERNVSGLCKQLGLAQPTVSHHLGLMREAGLLNTRRDGKQIFYSINREIITRDDTTRAMSVKVGGMAFTLSRTGTNDATSEDGSASATIEDKSTTSFNSVAAAS